MKNAETKYRTFTVPCDLKSVTKYMKFIVSGNWKPVTEISTISGGSLKW